MASAAQFLSLQQFEQAYGEEKPYYEYWFGEAIQKTMPTSLHGTTQGVLFMLLTKRGWRASCEVKLKLSPFCEPYSGSCRRSESDRIPVSHQAVRALYRNSAPDR